MLRQSFPSTDEGAAIYKGFMEYRNGFCKIFDMKETVDESLVEINTFLEENGYESVTAVQLDETYSYEAEPISISPHGYQEQFVLRIKRDSAAFTQVKFIEDEIIKFRDDRDWAQFHNPKDLAMAISIEANELTELFLWKKPEEAKVEKIKEELADVMIYALLLAEKYEFDIEEIILDKIKKNSDKYPIDKSKGTSKKYNQL